MNLPGPRRGRATAIPVALLLATASVVGCGIRTNDVPVDGGPAPTRASCDAPAEIEGGTEIFLLCGWQVKSVRRPVDLRGGNPGQVAETLLAELQSDPVKEEGDEGFRTEVPSDLQVSNTPGETLDTGTGILPVIRLSRGLGDLTSDALFQIVCTFAHSGPLGNGQSAALGGPVGSSSETPKPIPCAMATRAASAENAQQHLSGPLPGREENHGQHGQSAGVGAGIGEAGGDPTG
jgi:hypothetical protein